MRSQLGILQRDLTFENKCLLLGVQVARTKTTCCVSFYSSSKFDTYIFHASYPQTVQTSVFISHKVQKHVAVVGRCANISCFGSTFSCSLRTGLFYYSPTAITLELPFRQSWSRHTGLFQEQWNPQSRMIISCRRRRCHLSWSVVGSATQTKISRVVEPRKVNDYGIKNPLLITTPMLLIAVPGAWLARSASTPAQR
jgi:hypothetical protein